MLSRGRRSAAGYPDVSAVRPPRLIFIELKSASGSPTPAQTLWLQDLTDAGQETYLWYPSDWTDGTIIDTLR